MDKVEYRKLVLSQDTNYSELQSKIITSMPKTLVRYRTYNEDYTYDELVNGNVFLQYIGRQNDPFEGRFYISNDKYLQENRKIQMLESIFGRKIDSKIMDIAFAAIKPHSDKYTESIKIACFAEDASNLLMWSHYANSHKGYCVHYDTEKILSCIAKYKDVYLLPVIYSEELFDATDNFLTCSSNLAINPALFKGKCWEYEQEWRLMFYNYKKDVDISKINLKNAIKRVDLGCNCTDIVVREKIIEYCVQEKIEIYEKKISSKRFALEEQNLFEEPRNLDELREIEYLRKIIFEQNGKDNH